MKMRKMRKIITICIVGLLIGTGFMMMVSNDTKAENEESFWTKKTEMNDDEFDPETGELLGWIKVADDGTTSHVDGILTLETPNPSIRRYYYVETDSEESVGVTLEVKLQVITTPTPVYGFALLIETGYKQYNLEIYSNYIKIGSGGNPYDPKAYEMDTTDDYHVYRIVAKNHNVKVYVDGVLRIDTLYYCYTSKNRISWGVIARDWYGANNVKIDYVYYLTKGAFEPISPVANAGPDQTVYTAQTVSFDGSNSYDPDGNIVDYAWDFGDGNTSFGVTTTHAYPVPGIYNVTLTVMDNYGATDTDTCKVTVMPRRDLILSSADISFFPTNPIEGDLVTINATIHNIAEGCAENAEIGFYYNETMIGTTNAYIPGYSQENVSITWNTVGLAGNHTIRVVADPNNVYPELNETNNEAVKEITVRTVENYTEYIIGIIQNLSVEDFDYPNNKTKEKWVENKKKELSRRLIAALNSIDNGEYEDAIDGLESLKNTINRIIKNETAKEELIEMIDSILNSDADGDCLTFYDEGKTNHTDPYDPDTDDDFMPDGWEIHYGLNALHDGIYIYSYNNDKTYTQTSDPNPDEGADGDFDNDNLTNSEEYNYTYKVFEDEIKTYKIGCVFGKGLDPGNEDTDNDWLKDGDELNGCFANSTVDWDGDGVLNNNTNPLNNDTDRDGLLDGAEVSGTNGYVTSPVTWDTDDDGLYDDWEISNGYNPTTVDTDSDGVWDYYDNMPKNVCSVDWTDQYLPGMVRFTQEYDCWYLPNGQSEVWTHHYNLEGEDYDQTCNYCGTDGIKTNSINGEKVTNTVNSLYTDSNYSAISAEYKSCNSVTTYTYSAGGDFWHPKEYRLYYWPTDDVYDVSFKNDVTTTVQDDNDGNYYYAAQKISVRSGVDQSVLLQISIEPANDLTYFVDNTDYKLLAFSYALYKDDNFVEHTAFFSNVATAVVLNNHSYQIEIKIPEKYTTSEYTTVESNMNTMELYFSPIWVVNDGGVVSREAVDPNYMTVGSIIKKIPEYSYEVIAKTSENMTDILNSVPTDVAEYTTGYYTFGDYYVYVYNQSCSADFDQNAISNNDVKAVIILSPTEADAVGIRENIDWSAEWKYNVDSDVDPSAEVFKMATETLIDAFECMDLNSLNNEIISLTAIGTVQLTTSSGTINVHKVRLGSGDDAYLVTSTTKIKKCVGVTPDGKTTGTLWLTKTESETVKDLDKSKFLYGRHVNLKNGLKAVGVGAVLVTDGREAFMAYRDGDIIKGTFYTAATVTGVMGVVWAEKTITTISIAKTTKIPVRFGSVAIIVVGVIIASYNIYEASQTSDQILKLHYYEDASAILIDACICAVPLYGPVAELTWSAVIIGLSYFMPNTVSQQICSSPGSTITFTVEYFFTNTIPSDIAQDALQCTCNWMIDWVNTNNELGNPSIAILPE